MTELKRNWLDKTIGFISPKAEYNRLAWKMSLNAYDSGSVERPNTNWTVANQPAEQTNQQQRDLIRARARDLERNADVAEAIIGSFERNVIGTGLKLQAKTLNSDGLTENELLNTQIERLWKNWCRKKNCDITGTQSFQEMTAMAMRRIKVDGGMIFIKSYTAGGNVPLVLQAREVDDLDTTLCVNKKATGTRVINGIEVDQYNKPVAYWLKNISPDGLWTGQSERIDADRVIFLGKKKRPSQLREISELATTATRIKDINEYSEAVSMKERILACLSVFIKKMTPNTWGGAGSQNKDPKSDYKIKKIAPGMIEELQPGDGIETVNPSGQASNEREHIAIQQRLAASGQGLSYEAATRDYSQTNYSSARQGFLEDQRTYGMWQMFLIEHLCYEVYTSFVISAVLAGKLKIPDFWQNKENYLEHDWIAPGWSWIDPLKEVRANSEAISTGQTTLSQICASAGLDWRDVIKQRAKEQEHAKSMGIVLGADANSTIILDESNSTKGENNA